MSSSTASARPPDIFEEHKDLLYQLYMVQNKPLRAVSQYMREQHGVSGTDRQYKSRFKNWAWDSKKLKREDYKAMYVIQRQHGHGVKFGISTHDKNIERILTEDAITKEINRCKLNRWPTIDQSWEVLARHPARMISPTGATVIYPGYLQPEQAPETSNYLHVAATMAVTDTIPAAVVTAADPDISYGLSVADVATEVGMNDFDSGMNHNTVVVMHNQNYLTHIPHYVPGLQHQIVRQYWLTPQPWIFEAEVFCTMIPHTAISLNSSEIWPILIRDIHGAQQEGFSAERSVWEMVVNSKTGGLEAFVIDKHQHMLDAVKLADLLEAQLTRIYEADPDGIHKLQVVEHAGYYIGQCLAGHDRPEHFEGVDRCFARVQFAVMLRTQNPYVLTEVLSMIAFLGSHDRGNLLAAYLQDCEEASRKPNIPYDSFLQTTLRHAIAHHGFRTAEDSLSPLTQTAACRSRVQNRQKQRKAEFEQLLHYLECQRQSHSLTYSLVLVQYAWALVDQNQDHVQSQDSYETSLSLLLQCSERLRIQLGDRHIIRIGCLTATARLYERQNNLDMSIQYLREAIFKLLPTTNVLQAYRHRLYARLAELWARRGRLDMAAPLYKIVVDFRIPRFGYGARQTWTAVGLYHRLLMRLNRVAEAEELRRRAKLGWKETPREEVPCGRCSTCLDLSACMPLGHVCLHDNDSERAMNMQLTAHGLMPWGDQIDAFQAGFTM